jgi:nucleoside-diphosphate-sugar epimerase
MSRRIVVVTGADGFVGRALTEGFAALGWWVIGLDVAFDDGREDASLRGGVIRRVTCDLADGVPALPGMPGTEPSVDLVVHTAWVTTEPEVLGVTPDEYRALNLRPLEQVLEYVAATRPTAFVFLSSSGVFAASDGSDGLTDADEPTGSSPYAEAKRVGEAMTMAAAHARGTASYVVRLGYLFGPDEVARPTRQRVSLVARWVAAARAGRPLEVRADDPAREWTFAPDLAAAVERLVDGPAPARPVHLGSPHIIRDGEVVALIAAGRPDTAIVSVPAEGRMKPPMIASDLAALRDFEWTEVRAGLEALLAA